MSNRRKVEYASVYRVLMTLNEDSPGVFEQILGFRPSSASIKGVHLINDLAQTTLGGAPDHGGDFLCKVIRPDAATEERTTEADLRADRRFGAAFNRAFPKDLGARRVHSLRKAARLVTNFDGGMYKAGDNMASGLVTHRALLGFEGFRRLRVGQYIWQLLQQDGRERLRKLFSDEGDPVTRAMRPLLLEGTLVDKVRRAPSPPPSPFDLELGRGLSALMDHQLSKPVTLRLLALMASVGVILKIVGVGRERGCPLVLALSAEQEGPTKVLREEAVTALQRGFDEFYRVVAARMPAHPNAGDLWRRSKEGGLSFEVSGGMSIEDVTGEIVAEARKVRLKVRAEEDDESIGAVSGVGSERPVYWPERFAYGLGRRAGCVLPREDRAGWGKHLALTPEHVEALVLMVVPRGSTPMPWRAFWAQVRERFGIVVGANAAADAVALRQIGVPHASPQQLAANANMLLAQAVRRGVARRLPDSGAEVGGALS